MMVGGESSFNYSYFCQVVFESKIKAWTDLEWKFCSIRAKKPTMLMLAGQTTSLLIAAHRMINLLANGAKNLTFTGVTQNMTILHGLMRTSGRVLSYLFWPEMTFDSLCAALKFEYRTFSAYSQ